MNGNDILMEFRSPSASVTMMPMPRLARGTVWVVGTMLAGCIALAALVPVDKVITAQGRVVSHESNIVVQPLETAIVRSIDVREGQHVIKGQLLARLDPTFAAADTDTLVKQVDAFTAETERMAAELEGKPYDHTGAGDPGTLQTAIYEQRVAERGFKMENYLQKIRSLYATAQKAESDARAYETRLGVARQVENMRSELERGAVGSKLNTLSATDSRLEVQRGLDAALQTIESSRRDLQALIAERDSYDRSWRSELSQKLIESRKSLSDASESLRKAQLRRQLVEMRAESDAVVLSVSKVSPGSVLQSGDQFITLVPGNGNYEIEANIAGRDNGFVGVGDEVSIKFDTFPFAQYGMDIGRVDTVSPDSFTPQEEQKTRSGSVPVAQNSTEPYYRSRITITEEGMHDTPRGFRLVPGMPVTADIKVGKRTMMSYLLGKVIPVAREGMREP